MRSARLAHGVDTSHSGYSGELRRRYERALHAYLSDGDDVALRSAGDVGAFAVDEGATLSDVVLLHDEILGAFWGARGNRQDEAVVRRAAARFLAEALAPFSAFAGITSAEGPSEHDLFEILEREARRLAGVLHDGAGQLLFSMQLALAELMREAQPHAAARLKALLDLSGQLDDQLRNLSRELHPAALDELGLASALRLLIDRITSQHEGLQVTLVAEAGPRFPPAVERCLYRGAVEALSNVVRHARARRVTVTLLRHPRQVVCVVRDDGVGFGPAAAGWTGVGLSGIRTRLRMLHGQMAIRSEPGQGTTLTISIPIDGEKG